MLGWMRGWRGHTGGHVLSCHSKSSKCLVSKVTPFFLSKLKYTLMSFLWKLDMYFSNVYLHNCNDELQFNTLEIYLNCNVKNTLQLK